VWGRSTTPRGTTRSAVSSTVPSPTVLAVLGDAQSPRFDPFQINISGSALQRPFFGRNNACDPSPLSPVDFSSRRPKRSATSSPTQSDVGGTSPGNQYQKAREAHIDLFITWMEDDHPVDIAEKLKRPRVLRDFTKNLNAPQGYDQHVAWITRQYDLATFLQPVDSCLASTTSTQGDSPLSRFALIDSPLDESSWDDCLTFAEFEGRLMVTFVTINKTVMVDDTDNEIEYIKTIPLNLERTSTIRVKQEDRDSETSVIDVLDSSEDETSGDELDDMEEEEEGEGKEELPGMPEDQDDSDLGLMPITNNAIPSHSSGRTAKREDQDLDIQNAEELDRVDADFNNIAPTVLEGANDPDAQAQKEDQTDNVDVDW